MNFGDLQALMAQGPQAMAEAATLAEELTRLDARRAQVVARLGDLGIGAPGAARIAVPVQAAGDPRVKPGDDELKGPADLAEARGMAEQRLLRDALREAAGGDEYAEKRLNNLRARLAPEIDRLARELLTGPATDSHCCECAALGKTWPATTKIGENLYCDVHAAGAPRFAREGLAA